jgi:glucoamylase
VSSVQKITQTFRELYPVNHSSAPGVAIGRYPEDRYDGGVNAGGNPWVLLTAAMAQYYYRLAAETGIKTNINAGDDFLRRVQYHAPYDGAFSEQIDRFDGYMTSARDLTWSHSEVLEAFAARPHRDR